ncbi:MAG: hypothetical protein KA275_00390 [Chitinophagaceae bacterium]|nr:hypothetical protein [Chitinophagaceae bacterium]
MKCNILFAQTHQIGIAIPGAYFFNYGGYHFNTPFRFNFWYLPTEFTYHFQKEKKGIRITSNLYTIDYSNLNINKQANGLFIRYRNGLAISAEYTQQMLKTNILDVNVLGGLSTKHSVSSIYYVLKHSNGWNEGYFDPKNSQLGGLAINLGINVNIKLKKHIYFTSTLRCVNFLIGTTNNQFDKWYSYKNIYQRNTIWWENGIGYRFGKGTKNKQ